MEMSGGSSDQEEKSSEVADQKSEEQEQSVKIDSNPEKEEEAHASSPKKEEDSDDKDEESDDSEGGVGLLDRPVEVSGSRERKKVERLDVSFKSLAKEKHKIPEGSGKKLGDCPRIEQNISKTITKDLKTLHRILFNRPGSTHEVKKNIRLFNGFPFKKNSEDYEKKKKTLEKIITHELRHICEILDMERSGSKEEVVNRIMEFLIEPKPSGKEVRLPKKKKGLKRKNKEKVSKSLATEKSKSASSDEGSVASDYDENDKVDEGKDQAEKKSKDNVGSTDSDDSEVEQKKPKAAAKKKKQVKQKNEKPKKNGKKSAPKRSKKKIDTESSDEVSSDDAPIVKKAKSPPTNEEIKVLVKKILDASDLQEITMKTVIKQVFDEFPDFDLSDKKEFIKATVKSVIS